MCRVGRRVLAWRVIVFSTFLVWPMCQCPSRSISRLLGQDRKLAARSSTCSTSHSFSRSTWWWFCFLSQANITLTRAVCCLKRLSSRKCVSSRFRPGIDSGYYRFAAFEYPFWRKDVIGKCCLIHYIANANADATKRVANANSLKLQRLTVVDGSQ